MGFPSCKVVHTFDVPFRPPVTQNYGSPATALAFSPDGSRLATGMPDGTILLWRVPNLAHSTLATDKLDELWRKLVGQDDAKGWRAAWQLSEDPTSATELIQRMLKPAAVYDAKAVEQWIGQLDHADFRVREAAMKRSSGRRSRIAPLLPGQRIRMTFHRKSDGAPLAICEQAPKPGRPLPMWANALSRAIWVLESTHTDKANKLLAKLASGAPNAWLTHEAKEALERLKERQ